MKQRYFLYVLCFFLAIYSRSQSNPQITVMLDDGLPYTPQNLNAGDIINYTITVTNTGNVTLQNVVVSDNNATISGNTNIGNMVAGQTATFTATHIVTQTDIDAGSVSNTAVSQGFYNGNVIVDMSDDTDPSSPNGPDDPTITYILQISTLSLQKTDIYIDSNNNGIVDAGDEIAYSIIVSNTGNTSLSNVTVTDNNAQNLVYITGDVNNNNILNVGEAWSYEATHTIIQTEIDAGTVSNQATVTAVTPDGNTITDLSDDPDDATDIDPDGNNNPDDPTITSIDGYGKMSVEKVDIFVDVNGNGVANPGDRIDYTITITNTGNVTLTNISLDDPLTGITGQPVNDLTPGNSVIITTSYTLTQNNINNGVVSNQATVTYTEPYGNSYTNDSDDPDEMMDINGYDTEPYDDPDDPTITFLQTTGIDNYLANKIKVYPTIANDYIIVVCDNEKIEKITFINSTGKVMSEIPYRSSNIYSISDFISGNYLMLIKTEKGTVVKKIIKK